MNKVQKYSIRGLAILLAGLVLISTSGLRVYSHTCTHKQVTNYSLLIPAPECEDLSVVVEETSCCILPVESETTSCTSESNDKSCCSDHQQVVKLDTETLISQHKVEQKQLAFKWLPHLFAFEVPQTQSASTFVFHLNLPPPLTAPELLALFQVFLL